MTAVLSNPFNEGAEGGGGPTFSHAVQLLGAEFRGGGLGQAALFLKARQSHGLEIKKHF